jgi:hypothetical protein
MYLMIAMLAGASTINGGKVSSNKERSDKAETKRQDRHDVFGMRNSYCCHLFITPDELRNKNKKYLYEPFRLR